MDLILDGENEKAKRMQKRGFKLRYSTRYSSRFNIRFPLPTMLCGGNSAKLKKCHIKILNLIQKNKYLTIENKLSPYRQKNKK